MSWPCAGLYPELSPGYPELALRSEARTSPPGAFRGLPGDPLLSKTDAPLSQRTRFAFWPWRLRRQPAAGGNGGAEIATRGPGPGSDPLSAMQPRFNLVARWFARRFFCTLSLEAETVERLRALEARGAVVYAMHYASRLDYFLMNALFLRHGLRLSARANGIRFDYYGPLLLALRGRIAHWRRARQARRHGKPSKVGGPEEGLSSPSPRQVDERTSGAQKPSQLAEEIAAVEPSSRFVFLRTARSRWRRAAQPPPSPRLGDILDQVLDGGEGHPGGGEPAYVVPLALFWRKGPRRPRRFLNLAYGAPTRPSDFAKVMGFLANYQSTAVVIGQPVDVAAFAAARRGDSRSLLARKLFRAVSVWIAREQKIVQGPSLRPYAQVEARVLRSAEVERAISQRVATSGRQPERVRAEAQKILREIAASMDSTFLAVLNFAVTAIFRRLFQSIEVRGLTRVAEIMGRNPVVIVPSHRSYFDFLLLSWLFYDHYMVPPHIAARENMAFFPFGHIFRRAGAFFLRRSFTAPMYQEVFRAYISYLVREGFPQEFFIEGGRSRTGRSLAPKLGMLGWNVDALLDSGRRDLYFVPVAITYERLVEERAMASELSGVKKSDENFRGLLRARKLLRGHWGGATVCFDTPISLAGAMGGDRDTLRGTAPENRRAKRVFVQSFADRIVERINAVSVVNATSVAAAAFLGVGRRGLRRDELLSHMNDLVSLLRLRGAQLTPALTRDAGDFEESVAFLLRSDLIRSQADPRGEILYFEVEKRRVLDMYRNAILHFTAAASFTARRLLVGATRRQLDEDLDFWSELYYYELFEPRDVSSSGRNGDLLQYLEGRGIVEAAMGGDRFCASDKGRRYLLALARQTRGLLEAYAAAWTVVDRLEEPLSAAELERAAGQAFERAELLGQIQCPEAANVATFRGAVAVLLRRGILEYRGGANPRDRRYARGPAFSDLAGLSERLAEALGEG